MAWLGWLIGIAEIALGGGTWGSIAQATTPAVPMQQTMPVATAQLAEDVSTQTQQPHLAVQTPAASQCLVKVREHPSSPILQRDSHLVVGNKGEEAIEVLSSAGCTANCWRFDHAEIEIQSQRFGGVQFVSLPQPGCINCEPIKVRWYHEPTGFLSFAIRLYQRQTSADCEQSPQRLETMQ